VWDRTPASASGPDAVLATAHDWSLFARSLEAPGLLHWLGDLSRYELVRWKAAVFAAASPDTAAEVAQGLGRPRLAPGAEVSTFSVDVTSLVDLEAVAHTAPPAMTRLITWYRPGFGLQAARLGSVMYESVLACDGSRTIGQITAMTAADSPRARSRVAGVLHDLLRAGALRLSVAGDAAAEEEHSGLVQPPDSPEEQW
jgi:hypothetical protein